MSVVCIMCIVTIVTIVNIVCASPLQVAMNITHLQTLVSRELCPLCLSTTRSSHPRTHLRIDVRGAHLPISSELSLSLQEPLCAATLLIGQSILPLSLRGALILPPAHLNMQADALAGLPNGSSTHATTR